MQEEWSKYADKFLHITPREQYLILVTGFVFVTFVLYSLFIESNMETLNKTEKTIKQLTVSNVSNKNTIATFQQALKQDPNIKVNKEIAQYEKKLAKLDKALLALTSDLIDPVQMRYALLELLDLEKGVSLVSFELVGVEELSFAPSKPSTSKNITAKKTVEKADVNAIVNEGSGDLSLYRHGIKIKLKGSYFGLRDYLVQLEKLSWKFFWQDFQYNLQAYPESELEIEMYSLSTKREFIGV